MERDYIIAKVDALADGQMREVPVGDATILLVRIDGEYRAYGPACPHQEAPLAEGTLHEGRIRCPWHQSVFDARGGGHRAVHRLADRQAGMRWSPGGLEPMPRVRCAVKDGSYDRLFGRWPSSLSAWRRPAGDEPCGSRPENATHSHPHPSRPEGMICLP